MRNSCAEMSPCPCRDVACAAESVLVHLRTLSSMEAHLSMLQANREYTAEDLGLGRRAGLRD